MDRETWFGIGILALVLLFQAWVTLRLRRTPIFDSPEKRAQTRLIWLVPVIGAAIVFAVLRSEEQLERDGSGQSRGS